jgi:hypothetical protein
MCSIFSDSLKFLFIYLYYCCVRWGYIGAFTKVLSVYEIILEFTTPTAFFHHQPPPSIPGPVSTGTIFAFTYMCIHYLHHIHLPTPFPTTSPLPLVLTFQVRMYLCYQRHINQSQTVYLHEHYKYIWKTIREWVILKEVSWISAFIIFSTKPVKFLREMTKQRKRTLSFSLYPLSSSMNRTLRRQINVR